MTSKGHRDSVFFTAVDVNDPCGVLCVVATLSKRYLLLLNSQSMDLAHLVIESVEEISEERVQFRKGLICIIADIRFSKKFQIL